MPGRAAAALAGFAGAVPPRRPAAARRRRRRLRAAPTTRRCAVFESRRRRARRRRLPVLRHRHGGDQRRRARPASVRGDRVVLPSDGYYTTRLLAARRARAVRRRGRLRADAGDRAVAAGGGLDGARLVLLETPSNPQLDVCDIAAVARAAHAPPARCVAVDNTTATPLGQRPLDLGADLTVGSDTKALTGHSDLLLGHVSTRDRRAVRPARGAGGTTPATPRARSRRGWRTGRWARWTSGWPGRRPTRPRSPSCSPASRGDAASAGRGGPSDPSYALASRQMLRPNGVVSAELGRRGGRGAFLARDPAVDRGHQLRRRAQHRRPAGAVGRRRRRAGLRPALLRHRGHRRPGRGPRQRARGPAATVAQVGSPIVSTPRRTRVAVVFGGRSAEHAISCVSAGSVIAALDPERVRGRAGGHHPGRPLGAGTR